MTKNSRGGGGLFQRTKRRRTYIRAPTLTKQARTLAKSTKALTKSSKRLLHTFLGL